MWVLTLNNIHDNAECRTPIVRAETKAQLLAYVEAERVPPYEDKGFNGFFNSNDYVYNKVFRKGGPLELFNPPQDADFVNVGTVEAAMERARRYYEEQVFSIPEITDALIPQ